MPQTCFEGHDLVCTRGSRRVFQGLSFKLSAGGALVLQGPNGSGKSSLLRLCAGLLPSAGGQLYRGGVPVNDDPEGHRASLHYVGHANALKPVMTVRENLAFWAAMHGQDNGDDNRVEAALEAFRLTELADLPARYLSSGQQHRTALARLAAIAQPLWLLDEPVVGLDANSAALLCSLICDHQAKGGMVMVSTHTDLGLDTAEVLNPGSFAPTWDDDEDLDENMGEEIV